MGTIGRDTPASALGVTHKDAPPRGPHNMKPNRELGKVESKDQDLTDDPVIGPAERAAGRGEAIGSQAPARPR